MCVCCSTAVSVYSTVYIQAEHVREQATFLSNTQTKIIDNMHQMQVATIQIQQRLTDISATRGQDGLNNGFESL